MSGDFNKRMEGGIISQYDYSTMAENGGYLIEVCGKNLLQILNGSYQHKDI
jgi:hypothetical protein